MKKIKSLELLDNLKADTRQIILQTNYLLQHDPAILLQQPADGRWSVAQIIEHLNSYGRYYLPLIKESIMSQRHVPNDSFTPGWLGDYFTRSMLPGKDGKVANKMQSPKDHRPSSDLESRKVLKDFLQQESFLLELLDQASNANIERIRIPISISRFIKIRLGDTFRFLIAHHKRHFVQVQNTLAIVARSGQSEAAVSETVK